MPHIHEKIDYCSEVFIVHKNKVLLRVHDKYKMWLSVGGHVELNEDPNQAAVREAKEEVGLDIELVANAPHGESDGATELILPRAIVRHHVNPTHEHIVFIFFARSHTDKIVQTEDNCECRWFTREELDDPHFGIRPRFVRFAKQALDELE